MGFIEKTKSHKISIRLVGLVTVLVMVGATCSSDDNTAMYVEATVQAQALATLQAEATITAGNASKAIEEATDTQAKLAEELPPTPDPSATPEPSPTPPPTPYVKSAQEILVENVSTAIVFIETPMGIGTGFVVSDSGLIITAAHVIEGYDTVTIRPNRSNFTVASRDFFFKKFPVGFESTCQEFKISVVTTP